MVDEDAAHRACGDGEEMAAMSRIADVSTGELEPCLVDQGGRLQRVAGSLAGHLAMGDAPELVAEPREEFRFGGSVAVAHACQEIAGHRLSAPFFRHGSGR